jgi:glutamate-5-semialdehyde dehydrogenase
MDLKSFVMNKALEAKEGSRAIARASSEQKNNALLKMAEAIRKKSKELQKANKKDIDFAKKKGLTKAMIDRLTLTSKGVEAMAQGLVEIAALPDPIGEITTMRQRPNGMSVGKMRVPLGVISIIYESRPNVTADATGLCLKAGNAVVLDKTDRKAIMEMLKLEGIIDVVIPRGGEGLIRAVTENSRIPVLKHYKGVCHVFVDRNADLQMAEDICFNAKVQRPGTCNAMETMLVDEKIARKFLPGMIKKFRKAKVLLKGCPGTRRIDKTIKEAVDDDFYNEYVDLILNVRVVKDIDDAMAHIAQYSSAHTEAIVTEDYAKAMRFMREVDSASVHVNVSTRFSDGFVRH